MAKKKAAPTLAPPTPESVRRAARAGDFSAAVEAARTIYALAPTPGNLSLLKATLAEAAGFYADRDRAAEFNRVMAEAAGVDAADPAWALDRACLLARGGRPADALALAGDAARPKVLGHAADRAVRVRSKDHLPDEWHAGYDATLAAFRLHEAGDEAGARAALETIGLRSPFLDWKVFLRGLLAHAAADDARAAENFARLDPARLPARLAAPLRAAADPAYMAAQPPDAAAVLAARYQKLLADPLAAELRKVAAGLGRDKPLAPVFAAAEGVVARLKSAAPELLPRLANCLYHAIIAQGRPDDLPRYRKLFGGPPDDPQFHKLQAVVNEHVGDPAAVHTHWRKYEAWLAAGPAGWPPPLTARARAMVWERMGENARLAADAADDDEPMFAFMAPPRKKKPKPLDPPPEECFRHAARLAPAWPVANRKLFEALVESKRPAEAEAVARDFLAHHPTDLHALTALAGMLQAQGRADEAAGFWLRALAVNPLDKATRFLTATAVLGDARKTLTQGDPKAAAEACDRHAALLAEQVPAGLPALRSVIVTKLGKAAAGDAEALRAAAAAVPGARLGAAYRVMVDSQLAKLKPADKKAADQRFAAELVAPPTPFEVNQLVAAYDMYHIDGVTYRGQKTHEKKVLDQAGRCAAADAPEVDFERLLDLLVMKQEYKHAKKLADACVARFPKNPHVLLARCEAGLGTGEREYHVEQRLRRAKQLAEASPDPRHRGLADRIDAMMKRFASPFEFLDSFFDRG